MMQDQLDRSKAETEGILKMKAQVESVLEELGKKGLVEKEQNEPLMLEDGGKEDEDLSSDIWTELRKEFG
jgi:mediator of RNA polymerase II transcription subunit 7